MPGLQLDASSVQVQRDAMNTMVEEFIQKLPPLPPELEEFWIEIPTPDGWVSKTKVVKTTNATSAPLIVLFYGGGFFGGAPDQMTRPAREFAEKFGACVVCPTYRLLPEERWPVPMQDGYEVVRWLSSNAENKLGVDLSAGFVVGGASAGATISSIVAGLSVSPQSREIGPQVAGLAKPITGLFLCCGLFLTESIVPPEYKAMWTSRNENKDSVPMSTEAIQMIIDALEADHRSPWFSPVYELVKSELDFPKTYFQSCGLDPLRDDAVVFEKILASRGGKTKIDHFPEDGHTAWVAMPAEHQSTNPTFEEGTMRGMEWLLQK